MDYGLKNSFCLSSTRLLVPSHVTCAIAYSTPRIDDSSNPIQIGQDRTLTILPCRSASALPQLQLGGRGTLTVPVQDISSTS